MANSVRFRPEQEAILSYSGGLVGIAAVPGSGKTFTLAHLAARLVQQLVGDRAFDVSQPSEVLVVTFTNAAVNSFQARISRILREHYSALSPFVGYRVRTLHGLAHDIVRDRPSLVGLADDFAILDERLALDAQRASVVERLAVWRDRLSMYFDPEMEPRSIRSRVEQELPDLVNGVIKRAKDLRLSPDELQQMLQDVDGDERFELLRFAADVYADYQRSLAYRGAVDFDDLVRLALEALQRDEQYLRRLRNRWPYILEDEAQDSSLLQERMLQLLSDRRNWVRVGDPNQAINTTFTTADPSHLLRFLDDGAIPAAEEYPLSISGRSAPSIITLANELVRWTIEEHPSPVVRDAFTYANKPRQGRLRGVIQPADADDPQPNPPDDECLIHIHYVPGQKITPDDELELVVAGEDFSLVAWMSEIEHLPEQQRPTVAVLVPENSRGFQLAKLLKRHGVPYEELLRSTSETRETAGILTTVLEYMSSPLDLRRLKQLYWSIMAPELKEKLVEDVEYRKWLTDFFAQFRHVEDLLWPSGTPDWGRSEPGEDSVAVADLERFRALAARWLEAAKLPIDQLVLTIGQDLFSEPPDLALSYKIAVLLGSMAEAHTDWRLPEFAEELKLIASNQRRFIGFDDVEVGYEPKRGVVTIATMHAAKGLEWDRVYLMSVSNYGFPSALPYDSYIGERWYAAGNPYRGIEHLNLQAEAIAQLEALVESGEYYEGDATLEARAEYVKERLRLLYVGITRARREVIITWNMGRHWQQGRENQPAVPVVALHSLMNARDR